MNSAGRRELVSGTAARSELGGDRVTGAFQSDEAVAAGGLPGAPHAVRPLDSDFRFAGTAEAEMMPTGLPARVAAAAAARFRFRSMLSL